MSGLPTLYDKKALIHPKIPNATPLQVIIDRFKKPITKPGDRFLILKASTGGGKSTALPWELLSGFEFLQGKIVVTQPTRINVIKVATSMGNASWNDLVMGETVGFQTGQQSNRPKSGILYLTTGILLQQLKTIEEEKFLRKYSFIIIDEVHTRSTEIDLCLFLLKSLITKNYKREECPNVIMMSATFELPKYKKYFGTSDYIEVGGINFPITPHFPKYDADNVYDFVVDSIKRIIAGEVPETTPSKDIIVFASKMVILKELEKALDEALTTEEKSKLCVFILTGATFAKRGPAIKELDIPITKLKYERRIILSTNVAETGITLDDLKYVIDIGKQNTVDYDPVLNCTVQAVMPVTKGMATQRKGRVGRLFPGDWFPGYSEKTFEKMSLDQFPALVTQDNASVLLSLICYFPDFSVNVLDMLDNIPVESLHMSLTKLYQLGFIELPKSSTSKLNLLTQPIKPTKLGEIANKIRMLKMESIKLILTGFVYDVDILDLCTIVAFIESKWLSNAPDNKYFKFYDSKMDVADKHKSSWIKDKYFIKTGDTFLILLKMYDSMCKAVQKNKLETWCSDNNKDLKSVLEVLTFRDEIVVDILKYFSHNSHAKNNLDDFKRCLHEAYHCNLLTWDGKMYKTQTGVCVKKRVIFHKLAIHNLEINPPKYVITDDIILKGSAFKDSPLIYDYEVNYISILDGFVL